MIEPLWCSRFLSRVHTRLPAATWGIANPLQLNKAGKRKLGG